MDILKAILIAIIGTIAAYLEPVHNAILLLFIMAGLDIFFGLVAGVAVRNERFRFRKFILAAVYLLIYLGVVSLIYTVGLYQGDLDESLFLVKTVTYVFIYFYGINILKNVTLLFPGNRVVRFLYYVAALEFTKKLPWLSDFLKYEKNSGKG